ncbi:hypothetical protein [Acinetobacter sp. ANC 3813]|uniref:hypothetical protein n=1 Tax=Acinetobacter sp. ANC 3813 TaxID=1977873 RepID=UPI000A330414|nr:hypothetical protein [Acinetobacter sp. ANC 3813]OTG86039.1 hypothetical protein B9T34_18285 [Acinetobacter sp. ANC 3813]
MTDMNDYDDAEDSAVDDEEAKAAEKGASDSSEGSSDGDVAEAETLTVTAKLKQRQSLEDEVAAFLARGGKITEVPPDEAAHD